MAPQRKFSQTGDRFPKWAGPQKRERPANFMTRTGRFQRLNDHIFVCRREACGSYFEHLPGMWDACDAAVRRFAFPPQKYLFPEGEADNTLIDVPYTLVRPGPCVECHRVGGCDATGQGCRTKALLPYRTTCHRLAAEIDNTRS